MKWLLVCTMVVLGIACGGQPSSPAPPQPAQRAPAQSAPAPPGLLYLRSDADGAIQVVTAASGRVERTLPAGTVSPDWRWLYRLSAGAVQVVDPLTGLTAAAHTVPGWAESVVTSDNGRWLVLGQPGTGRFQVQDAAFAAPPVAVSLPDRFSFDALSSDGSRLYLLETIGPGHYQVRMYDLGHGALSPQVISDKQEIGKPMSGQALSSLPTGDGALRLTLYQRSADGRAFVHALPVSEDVPFALCVDLPGPASGWGFVAGPGGRRFYAVNPVGGVLVELSAAGGIGYPSLRQRAIERQPARPDDRPPAAVVAPDGSTLYVALAGGLAAVDTRTLTVRARGLAGERLDALGVAPDGSVLYALAGGGRLLRVDPRSLSVAGTTSLDTRAGAIVRVT